MLIHSVVDDFFSNPGAPANFSSPAHLVQLGGRGERKIYYYQRGFKFLKFNTRECEYFLQLMLTESPMLRKDLQRSGCLNWVETLFQAPCPFGLSQAAKYFGNIFMEL